MKGTGQPTGTRERTPLDESIEDAREELPRFMVPDWDGNGAKAVTTEMMERAFAFARDVDDAYRSKHGRPAPSPNFSAYGGDPPNVKIEWERRRGVYGMVILVSVRSDHVGYYGEIGDRDHRDAVIKGERSGEEAIDEIVGFIEKCNSMGIDVS